ncbi:hypothetical protein E4U47_006521 [Claviceps purpurea]|nr:hypothetical protein E4U47_006521 [Claviceps purpurea]
MDSLIHIEIPKDPMPVDPRTILATMVHLDHKVIPGMMAHLDHMAVDIMAPLNHLDILETLLPPMALKRNINTPTNLTTLKHAKAVLILNMKPEGAAEEFLMPKVTIFKHRCKRARATPDDWAELFSVMLAGKALTWYMNTLEGHDLTFEDAVMGHGNPPDVRNALQLPRTFVRRVPQQPQECSWGTLLILVFPPSRFLRIAFLFRVIRRPTARLSAYETFSLKLRLATASDGFRYLIGPTVSTVREHSIRFITFLVDLAVFRESFILLKKRGEGEL